jgi:hypothetical protein
MHFAGWTVGVNVHVRADFVQPLPHFFFLLSRHSLKL